MQEGAQDVPRNHLSVAEFNRSPFLCAFVHGSASLAELCFHDWHACCWSTNLLLFVFSRARRFLWVHHCVVDRSDMELRSIHVWGEGTVGPSDWEPDLCQPAVLRERKEQGTKIPNITSTEEVWRLAPNHSIVITLQLCCFIYIPLFALIFSFPTLTLPRPLLTHFKLSHVGGCQTGAPQCGGSLIRTDRHQR